MWLKLLNAYEAGLIIMICISIISIMTHDDGRIDIRDILVIVLMDILWPITIVYAFVVIVWQNRNNHKGIY